MKPSNFSEVSQTKSLFWGECWEKLSPTHTGQLLYLPGEQKCNSSRSRSEPGEYAGVQLRGSEACWRSWDPRGWRLRRASEPGLHRSCPLEPGGAVGFALMQCGLSLTRSGQYPPGKCSGWCSQRNTQQARWYLGQRKSWSE